MPKSARASGFARDVAVIGGCGRAGLPLAIAFADRGAQVVIYDLSDAAVGSVNAGRLPFAEPGAVAPLARVVADGRLAASSDPAVVGTAEHLIMVVGTPIDEDPRLGHAAITGALSSCSGYLVDGQVLVLRSTVSPGVTARVEKVVADLGVDVDIAFCPERIAEGHAMTELYQLPQIVSSHTARGLDRASSLFGRLTTALVPMSPEEAELAKLFTNAWRYIRFATANQLYMIANDRGLDFERIRQGLTVDYPRAADMPRAGLAGGPCLHKDTLHLAAAADDFELGRAAIAVNEGMPGYLAHRLEQRFALSSITVGILGMAFKGDSDDTRDSLAYQLKEILSGKCHAVLCTDPHVRTDADLLPLDQVLARADLLVIAAPHAEYAGLATSKPVADIWNVLGRGVRT